MWEGGTPGLIEPKCLLKEDIPDVIMCFKFGFSVCWQSNFAIPHWLCRSSLQHSQTTMWACDISTISKTRKPSYRWQTRATRKPAKNCSNSTCLQRCRWQYWPIFIRLAVVASEICEIPRNSLKIQTYGVQGHPRSSILVTIESPCSTTSY